MPDEEKTVGAQKAMEAVGATTDTSDTGATDQKGPPLPKEPSNTPPVEAKPGDLPGDTPPVEEPPVEEAPKAEEPPVEEAELDTEKWGTTGDEVGDSVLALLQNADLSVDDAKSLMYDAMVAGDVSKINKDALIEKVGKAKANLILAGAENFATRTAARSQSIIADVHGAVGGEDNWNTVREWANTSLTPDQLADYRDLVNAGGTKARFAAQEMLSAYNADAKNTSLNTAGETLPDTPAQSTGRSIGRAAYYAELEKAHATGARPSVIAEIQQARERGRAAGI